MEETSKNNETAQLGIGAVMPSCLRLSLKSKWFEMTKAGIKTEDYREINEYWIKRLVDYFEDSFNKSEVYFPKPVFKNFTQNTMTLGYPKSGDTGRIIRYEHAGIEIRTGNTDWGAVPVS